MGADLLGDDVASGLALTEPRFCFNFASKWPQFSPRSGHDRASIVVLVIRRSPSDQLETIPRQNLLDRGSIAPRSWSSSTSCLRRRIGIRCSRDLHEEGRIALDRGRRIGIRCSRNLHEERRIALHVAVRSVKFR